MSNPGPSSSSTVNQTALTVSTDIYGKVQNVYGAGSTIIDQYSFSKAIAVPSIVNLSAISTGVAPTGSVAANGALTLGTALANIYGPTGVSTGIWLYFPTGAVYAGSVAGSYWCVMTSTTLGTIYNNIYTPPGVNLPPANPIPIVAAGPGAYTGVTTEVPIYGFTIKALSAGLNGALRNIALFSFNNTANAKTGRIRFGGITGTVFETINAANNATANTMTLIYNRNNYGLQVCPPTLGLGLSTSQPLFGTVDTTQDQVLMVTVQLSTATDYFLMESMQQEVFVN